MKQHIFIPFALILLLSTSLTRAIDDEADIPPADTTLVTNETDSLIGNRTELKVKDVHSDIEKGQRHARWNIFKHLQFSKKKKIRLILTGLSLAGLAVTALAEWAIWTQWKNEPEDNYYCTRKCDGSLYQIDPSTTDCAELVCEGAFEQGPPIVKTFYIPGAGKIVTGILTGMAGISMSLCIPLVHCLKTDW